MNIFLTGATGFIGKSFLSNLLNVLGTEDRCFVLQRREFQFEDKRVVQLIGSFEEISQFRDDILNCEYFFHLAANPIFGSNLDYDKVNYKPTAQIVDILTNSKRLRNFIFTSTIGAVDRAKDDNCKKPLTRNSPSNPTSSYGKSKLKSEEYIVKSGIPFTIIRPTWVYGKDMRANSHINKFVSMVYQKSFIPKLHFQGKVSLIHVEDLSRALVNCLNNDEIIGKIYFAETEALSLGSIFRVIYEKVNHNKIRQIKVPRFRLIFERLHNRIPLTVSNLFLDYLYAQDKDFKIDFRIQNVKNIYEYIDDVISTNTYNGYWIITGANSGIGYTLARRLDNLKKKLILIDKDTNNLNLFKNQIVFKADLSSFAQIEKLARAICQFKIFCLINNAGIGFRGSLQDLIIEEIRKLIDVNICYPILFTKLILDNLIKNGSVIVNISSSVAYNPLPYMSLYSATKAFLSNWSESITYELRKTNKIITFSPSGTYTNFQKNAGVKVVNGGKDLLTPEYVANEIIKAVYGKKNIVILGFKTKIFLTISRILPRKINIYLWGRLFECYR